MTNKERIDCALVSRGLAESREKAKAIIMSGIVFVNNQKCDKAGYTVKPEDVIEIRGGKLKYVSRGGLTLEKAEKSGSEYEDTLEDTTINYFYALYMLSRCDSFMCSGQCNGYDMVCRFNENRFDRVYKFAIALDKK